MFFVGELGQPADSGFSANVISNGTDGPYGLALTLAGFPLLLAMRLPPPLLPDRQSPTPLYHPWKVRYRSGGSRPKRSVGLRWQVPGDKTQITFS